MREGRSTWTMLAATAFLLGLGLVGARAESEYGWRNEGRREEQLAEASARLRYDGRDVASASSRRRLHDGEPLQLALSGTGGGQGTMSGAGTGDGSMAGSGSSAATGHVSSGAGSTGDGNVEAASYGEMGTGSGKAGSRGKKCACCKPGSKGKKAGSHGHKAGSHGKKCSACAKKAGSHDHKAGSHDHKAGSHGKKCRACAKKAGSHHRKAGSRGKAHHTGAGKDLSPSMRSILERVEKMKARRGQ